METNSGVKVFCSYSHIDKELRDELEKHLGMMKRSGLITTWHDRMITAGQGFEDIIDKNLNSADIVLLLVSVDFINSYYCYDKEMKPAMQRHVKKAARVIPVILRPVDLKGAEFNKLLKLPTDGKAITTWNNIDAAFLDVANGIRAVVEELNLSKNQTAATVETPLLEVAKELSYSNNQLSDENNPTIIKQELQPMTLWVHGWDRQDFSDEPDHILDWTKHFNIKTSPRTLPDTIAWDKEIIPQIDAITKVWAKKYVKLGGKVRVYAKCCLSGGVLIGNRLSRTRGAVLEVEHYGQLWISNQEDADFKVTTEQVPGNSSNSKKAVVILSVSHNIMESVCNYLNEEANKALDYKSIINVLPENGVGQTVIQGEGQAVKYALETKTIISNLISKGIQEIHLFLNTPFSIALFVGHYLTAVCPIQTYEYTAPGYTISCRI